MRELTAKELEQSASGPKFESIKPADLFSATASCALAQRVRTQNPRRYFELRLEWQYITGQEQRPDSFYD
jgi:hypothetical protein